MRSEGKKILVVDNNDEDCKTLWSLLENAGHSPTTTWSGIEALQLLTSQEFDLVLVSGYLADIYIGEFFERFNRLSRQPCVLLIEEQNAKGLGGTLAKIERMSAACRDPTGEIVH